MAKSEKTQFILAHGAGAPCTSDWMNLLTEIITDRSKASILVHRFNFDYMEKRVIDGRNYPPDRMPKLLSKWTSVIKEFRNEKQVFIGGKSMGGRAASLLNFNELPQVSGLINFGFPFHAPGKPPGERIIHLENLQIPCLINQGERDPMGTKEEIRQYKLSKRIEINYLVDGNHDLKPRVKSGVTLEENLTNSVDRMIKFIGRIRK